jgi:hypothetical protein
VARENFNGPHVWDRGEGRRDERDWRDERDEVGIQSVRVAPFSLVSRFTRHGLVVLADFFNILMGPVIRRD